MQLIVICSWCQKFMRFKKWIGDKPPVYPVTHSICTDCKEKVDEEMANIIGGRYETKYQTSIG